ncbi:hypothetical protein D3C85_1351020 [compost metagenome]
MLQLLRRVDDKPAQPAVVRVVVVFHIPDHEHAKGRDENGHRAYGQACDARIRKGGKRRQGGDHVTVYQSRQSATEVGERGRNPAGDAFAFEQVINKPPTTIVGDPHMLMPEVFITGQWAFQIEPRAVVQA